MREPMTDARIERIRWRVRTMVPGPLKTDIVDLLAEVDRIQGWGDNTVDGCLSMLTKARDAVEAVLVAVGSGRGASELLDELDEAVRQLSAGRRS